MKQSLKTTIAKTLEIFFIVIMTIAVISILVAITFSQAELLAIASIFMVAGFGGHFIASGILEF